MNGFTNAILSLLLGWIRIFINSLWKMVNSDNGGHLIQFLANNWIGLLLALCAGGFVVDRIVYLIRWRPYYVWLSKRRRLRREREAYARGMGAVEAEDEAADEWDGGQAQGLYAVPPVQPAAAVAAVAPPIHAYTPAAQPTAAYQRPVTTYPEENVATAHYAPVAQGMQSTALYHAQPYAPPADLAPVFDDDLGGWGEGDTLVRPLNNGIQAVSDGMDQAYGSAMPEPIDYIRDMQAGFAKPVPPEQLYSQPVQEPPAALTEEEQPVSLDPRMQVHPGLDMANFRRNIGLAPAGSLVHQQEADEDAPAFRPYSEAEQPHQEVARPRNPFASLAKKARGFVGVSEEEDKPTIRDLQPMVDVRTAFHEPVYPKPMQQKDGDKR